MYTTIPNKFSFPSKHQLLAHSFLAFAALMLTQPYIELYRALFYTACIPLLYCLLRQLPRSYKDTGKGSILLQGSALLIMAMACSLLSSEESFADSLKIVRQGLITLIFFYAAYLFGRQCHKSTQHYGNLLQIILIISLCINLWHYFSNGHYPLRIAGISRVLQNPIQGSQIFTVLFLLSLYLKRHHALSLSIVTALLTAGYIYLGNSRGTIFSLALALLLVAIASRHIPSKAKLVGLLIAACSGILILQVGGIYDYLFSRDFHRLEIWSATLAQLDDYWLIGHGYGSPFDTSPAGIAAAQSTQQPIIMHPHSLYMATLYHGGIVSLAMLIVFITNLCKLLYRDDYGLMVLLFVLLICSTDNSYLFSSIKENWLLFWLPVGLLTGHIMQKTARVN